MDFDSNGVRLHYDERGPSSGRPIVLVHGFASDYRLNWVGTRWEETLTKDGFHVLGLDCRGHGQSDKPQDVSAYSPATMAADVVRLLDHHDWSLADYLGFSMGARIGLQAVLDFPGRWRRVVLGGLGLDGVAEQAESIARALRGGRIENPVSETFYRFAAGRASNDLEALAACIVSVTAKPDLARLGSIRTPILIVVGEKDELARDAPELVEMIPSARLVTVPGRDHLATVPAREFKNAALEFLEEEHQVTSS